MTFKAPGPLFVPVSNLEKKYSYKLVFVGPINDDRVSNA